MKNYFLGKLTSENLPVFLTGTGTGTLFNWRFLYHAQIREMMINVMEL